MPVKSFTEASFSSFAPYTLLPSGPVDHWGAFSLSLSLYLFPLTSTLLSPSQSPAFPLLGCSCALACVVNGLRRATLLTFLVSGICGSGLSGFRIWFSLFSLPNRFLFVAMLLLPLGSCLVYVTLRLLDGWAVLLLGLEMGFIIMKC